MGMAYCYICGDERNLHFRNDVMKYICKACSADTPRKMGREEFYKRYFEGNSDCPDSIKREFYEDYRASSYTYGEYVKATVSYTI